MNKMEQDIIVVSRELLFQGREFQGFLPAAKGNYFQHIQSHSRVLRRGEAETNTAYKQPIGYVVLVHRPTRRIYTYQRSTTAAYEERRLAGKWAWGLGGHSEPCDEGHPVKTAVLRELLEEVGVVPDSLTLAGYINTDEDEVGQVHFGVLFIAETDNAITSKDPAVTQGKLLSIEEISTLPTAANVENWSILALPAIKEHLARFSRAQ